MHWTRVCGARRRVTRSVVGGALIVLAVAGAAVPAAAMPLEPPPGPPTGPGDPACISQPADPVCQGGPYALPTPPQIAPPPPAPAGMGGMPGHI